MRLMPKGLYVRLFTAIYRALDATPPWLGADDAQLPSPGSPAPGAVRQASLPWWRTAFLLVCMTSVRRILHGPWCDLCT